VSVQKFTLDGTMNHPITGIPLDGYILTIPSNELVDTADGIVFPPLGYQVPVVGGVVNPGGEVTIPYTDNVDISPAGWTLVFTERFSGMSQNSYSAFVTSDMGPTVNIADLVKLADPPAVVQYVISGHPMTVSGVPDVDDVLTATSSTQASWQPAQGGGGGGAVSTVFGRSGDVTAQSPDYAAFYDAIGTAAADLTTAENFTTANIAALALGTASTHAVGDFDAAGAATAAAAAARTGADADGAAAISSAIGALNLGTKSKQNSTNAVGLLCSVISIEDCIQSGGNTLTSGFHICNLIRPDGPITLSQLGIWLTLAGVTASGYNGLALYTEAGVLIDQTPDMSVAFAGTGYIPSNMSTLTNYVTSANTNYYLSVLSHFSGTVPKAAGKLAGQNIPPINGHYFSVSKSGVATFPANFTPSSYSTSSGSYFMGVS
jgi:hypothetical protein